MHNADIQGYPSWTRLVPEPRGDQAQSMTTNSNEIIKLVDKMPAFPQGVTKVLELTARADCSSKDLIRVIEHDPVMTMKILKLVNSAFFGLTRPINSISHGVVFVGINTIKNLALTIAAIGMLPSRNDAGFNINEFLLHSIGVAGVAKRLAGELGVPDKDATDYFVAGLLHDFGKVVLAQFKPAPFRQALDLSADGSRPLHQAEREVLGLDHAEIGGLLAERWKLPLSLADCIRRHHRPHEALEDGRMRDSVFAANQIVHSIAFGRSGNAVIESFPPPVAQRFGQDLPGLIASLGNLDEEMSKARAFIQS
jgi:putative nucleotidyltransferase with HDIG domain